MEVQLCTLLGNYDKLSNRPNDQRPDRHTGSNVIYTSNNTKVTCPSVTYFLFNFQSKTTETIVQIFRLTMSLQVLEL